MVVLRSRKPLAVSAAGFAPEKLLIPTALNASCAFMLPVATAPNAIVFGTGKIESSTMLREGVVLNFMGVAVISLCCLLFFIGPLALDRLQYAAETLVQ